MSGSDILMDRPAGGWSDLVTNHTLDLRFDAFEARMNAQMDARFARVDARFADLEHRFDRFELELIARVDQRLRAQSWVSISTTIAAMGVIVAAIRL